MLIDNSAYSSRMKHVSQSEPTPSPDQGTSTPPKTGVAGTPDAFENQKQVANSYDKPTAEPISDPPADAGSTVDPSDLTKFFGEFGNERTESTRSENLSAILDDPTLPFEEKMALFLFEVVENAQKDLLSRMEQIDKSGQKSTGAAGNSKQPTTGPDGANGNQGTETASGGNVQNGESEQIALEKLKLAHEKMNKMFSIVDNILTSNNRTVKEGPIAALKG
jgi:hypothetical protein